jgi:colanic acid/amylovoran biosynthesis glycosyltransferase
VKEAMATGLPVIATRHGGIPELVEDGVSGFLVPEADIAALAEKIAYLIDHAEIWERMAAAARAKIEAAFDSDKLNQDLLKLYERAASKERTVAGGLVPGPIVR